MKSNRTFLLMSLIFIMLSSFFCARFYSIQQNSLFNNKNWSSTKVSLKKGVVGAVAFFTTRRTLVQDHLDLGSWHGLNEIILKKEIDPIQVSFDFLMEPKSHLVFLYGKNRESFNAIRFSTSELFPSAFLHAEADGHFSNVITFVPHGMRSGWNKAIIQFGPVIKLFLNDEMAFMTPFGDQPAGKVGFRGFNPESTKLLVDNLKIMAADRVFAEDFSNPKEFTYFLICVVFLTFMVLVFRRFPFHTLGLLVTLSLVSGIVYYVDYNYFYDTYPTSESQIDHWLRSVNVSEFKNNVEYDEQIKKRVQKKFNDSLPASFHLALLGSSQTWGAGASTLKESLEEVLLEDLNKRNPDAHVELLNLAVSGHTAETQYEMFSKYSAWPDLVIINLSNNDGGQEKLHDYIEKIILVCQKQGTKVVLVAEPNFPDAIRPHLMKNHDVLRQLAQTYHLKVIELHSEMTDRRHFSFLWWDNVHMTSFGQRIAAEFIARHVSPLPRQRRR